MCPWRLKPAHIKSCVSTNTYSRMVADKLILDLMNKRMLIIVLFIKRS